MRPLGSTSQKAISVSTVLDAHLAALVARQASPGPSTQNPVGNGWRHLALRAVCLRSPIGLVCRVALAVFNVTFAASGVGPICQGHASPKTKVLKAALATEGAGHGRKAAAAHTAQSPQALSVGGEHSATVGCGNHHSSGTDSWRRRR